MMSTLLTFLLLTGCLCRAFTVYPEKRIQSKRDTRCFAVRHANDAVIDVSRRDTFIKAMIGSLAMGSSLLYNGGIARADVSDGNALPQGAAQFSRVLRLKSDLQAVKKRVATGGNDIDKQEWDNISRFLRTAYSSGDDMKAVAGGIADPEKKKRALADVDLVRQYAQAGEIPVNKKSGEGLVPVLEKMSAIVEDFLDALSDVPDEI